MKFSIVTPSFNQGKYIEQTIKSVVEQQGNFDIEYFVMDGGSTDNTVNILQKYSKLLRHNQRIKFFWQSKKDKGQSDAINQGLKKSTGDICAFINSDDYYEKNIFKHIAQAFKQQSQKKWLTGPSHIVNEHQEIIQKFITLYKNFWLRFYSYKTLLILNYISQPSTFFKKELIENHGYFSETLNYCMDYDFWLKIGKQNTPIICNEYISNFRIHSQSKGKVSYQNQFQEDLKVVKNYTTNPLILNLHQFHNHLITVVYRNLKK